MNKEPITFEQMWTTIQIALDNVQCVVVKDRDTNPVIYLEHTNVTDKSMVFKLETGQEFLLDLRQIKPKPGRIEGKVHLTSGEWMSLINKEKGGLPSCCANISNLRDLIISIARCDGEINEFYAKRILLMYRIVLDGHDVSKLRTLNLLIEQVEKISGLSHADMKHDDPDEEALDLL